MHASSALTTHPAHAAIICPAGPSTPRTCNPCHPRFAHPLYPPFLRIPPAGLPLAAGADPNLRFAGWDTANEDCPDLDYASVTYGPVHDAAELSPPTFQRMAAALLDKGADIKLANWEGETVLHQLCYDQWVDEDDKAVAQKIAWLVEHGANPNQPNRRSQVPLEIAMEMSRGGKPHQAIALLESGADIRCMHVRRSE